MSVVAIASSSSSSRSSSNGWSSHGGSPRESPRGSYNGSATAPPSRTPSNANGKQPSLVISPNLDALLEHEERVRSAESPTAWASYASDAVVGGLPPPPRPNNVMVMTPRSPMSPMLRTTPSPSHSNESGRNSNPYINPAPLFVEGEYEGEGQEVVVPPAPRSLPISPPPRVSSMMAGSSSNSAARVSGSSGDSRLRSRSSSAASVDSRVASSSPLLSSRPPRLLAKKQRAVRDIIPPDAPPLLRERMSKGKLVKRSGTPAPSPSIDGMERRQGSVDRDSLDGPSILRSSSQRSSIYDPPVDSDRDSFIDFESELGPFIAADRTSLPLRPKPPLPTVPVPDHLRRRSHLPPPQHSHTHPMPSTDTMPPTTNYLQPTQRAQLVKKTRKLAQVFGQTPGAAALDPSGIKQQQGAVRKLPSVQRRKRDITPWPAADDDGTTTIQLTANGRRHSEPTTPVSDEGPSFSRMSISSAPDSPRSFIDFDTTQELEVDDTASVLTRTTIPPSPSAFSVRTLSPEEQAEEDRRRKREKLAKLHRFLGSRVPANLVLGIDFYDTLPPTSPGMGPEDPDALRKTFLMRRRSSSAAVLTTWSDDIDRLKEELGDKEKAIIVRRAQKMEKVFGVAPPQKLFSAKHASSTTSTPHGTFPRSAPGSPVTTYTAPALNPYTIGFNVTTTTTTTTNPNQGSYKRSGRARPSTAESGEFLLPSPGPSTEDFGAASTNRDIGRGGGSEVGRSSRDSAGSGGGGGSFVYTHYQHSLNSLHDILDRNDKESLAELHQYLNDSSAAPPTPPSATGAYAAYTPSPQPSPSAYTHAHTRTARRRSLPANARASMSSLASLGSIGSVGSVGTVGTLGTLGSTAPPTPTTPGNDTFQARRRRAAKLTQFFGVDYRDLIEDVLESIENGLDAERSRGTLGPDEAEELLHKLRTLKTKRT